MTNEMMLKYGCNPNQTPARIFTKRGALPIQVLGGSPGYINLLDALNGYQLVRELKQATTLPAAASFKHVSPAGAALAVPLSDTLKKAYFVEHLPLSPIATAYARARGADRISSYGDFIALSDPCDVETAQLIALEVSDGIIAPGYEPGALEILAQKRNGKYNIIQIDESYTPDVMEQKDCYGITFEQARNTVPIDDAIFKQIPTQSKQLTDVQKRDLILSLITLKYTQSNSVCCALDGQVIGIGAGQQSRIHCTRLATNKADIWFLRQHPKVLNLPFRPDLTRPHRDNAIDLFVADDHQDITGDGNWEPYFIQKPCPLTMEEKREWLETLSNVCLGSDAFFPFGDNIIRAQRSGVSAIIQPGGSIRDDHVINTCNQYNITMAFTGIRLFHH